jgi:hypothetical protein
MFGVDKPDYMTGNVLSVDAATVAG